MDGPESRLRDYLIKNVDDHGHFCPVEAHMSQPGIPDYCYTIRGINGWLELKAGTMTRAPNLRVMQKVWLNRNVKNGGNPLIFCSITDNDNTTFGLIHGNRADKIYMAKKTKVWIDAFNAVWADRVVWPEFLTYLCSPEMLK